MNEDKTEKTYEIRKRIIEYLNVHWKGEQPVVTVHEGKIGRDRMVHVSNGIQMTLDAFTDENVNKGYPAFDVIVNPLAYREYSVTMISAMALDKYKKITTK
tara:strand:+ start:477 stop:779 length:303 start_codon:yes stop_codon:yes gene_type:complete